MVFISDNYDYYDRLDYYCWYLFSPWLLSPKRSIAPIVVIRWKAALNEPCHSLHIAKKISPIKYFKFVVCFLEILSILSNACCFMVNDHLFGIFLCWLTIILNIFPNLKLILYIAKLTQNTAPENAIPCYSNYKTYHIHLLVMN